MAVQAGCGFKPPTPVFAVPLPVSGEPARRLGMTSSAPRDPGSDVIVGGRRSGTWVTLSKTLLLQLVERICQLSFQSDVMTSSPPYRKSADELGLEVENDSFRQRSLSFSRSETPPDITSKKDNCHDIAKDGEESQADDYKQSTADSVDQRPTAASGCIGGENSTAESRAVDASTLNVGSERTESSESVIGVDEDRGRSDAATSERNHHSDRRHRRRHQRSACLWHLMRTRRRKKATSSGQVRCQVEAGRSDNSRTAVERRLQLRGVRRCRQPWMALSKDIVYGAVESELRHVGGSDRLGGSVVPASSPAKSTAIWNPATCLSPSEKQRSRSSHADLDCLSAPTNFSRRNATLHQPGSDVVRRPRDATSTGSSMLSELLGFGAATQTAVLPAEVLTRQQYHCSSSVGETSMCGVVSLSSKSSSAVKDGLRSDHAHVSGTSPRHVDVSTALNYCIRRDMADQHDQVLLTSVPRIWRPVESYPRRVTRPRWVAVNKGDVCSLVDNLVSTMIASEDRRTAGVRDASTSRDPASLPLSTRCSVAASEPRKWKSDLLQRMRSEDT